MSRTRTVHRCTDCGAVAPKWSGRCASCGAWNTLVEEVERRETAPARAGREGQSPTLLADLPSESGSLLSTGLGEMDRVLGGGLFGGSVTLLGGEPGIGKSTLLLQAAASLAAGGSRCLIVSAEESPTQVRQRAERLGALGGNLWIVGETSLPAIQSAVDEVKPEVLIVDSIQTVWDPELESAPGSVSQVRECAHQLAVAAKSGGPAVILVGHVTKDGALAGPRVLEHLVDTVLSFEGERHHALRMLRAVKHRFGATGELGLFEMTAAGLQGVADAGSLFLSDRRPGTPGSVVFPAIEGHRPLLVEIQALVVHAPNAPSPRRSASGYDPGRLALLLAVLDRRAGLRLGDHEVYVSVVGGVKVDDPGADLAVCMALASAKTGRPVAGDLVVVGEVGLGGEVRQVTHTPRRLAEAARLGFAAAVVPPKVPADQELRTCHVTTLAEAVRAHVGGVAASEDDQGRSSDHGSQLGHRTSHRY
ncbi:MAG TPA: DNA repair protein RadA [Acidimicrobiales bacterium]|nr:DNA repair protein RadA [Acidimicrobiales bacterium]